MATTRQTRQFLTAVAALILGTYGTQANHFTVDNQGIAADSVLIGVECKLSVAVTACGQWQIHQ